MQKSIKEHTRSNFPLRKKKWQTQVVIFHVFFLFMLGWGWGGIISINLGYKGGLPLPPKKISYEEGGGSSYTTTGYPSNPAIHPPPLKMNGPLAEEISLGNSIICSDIWHKYHEWYSLIFEIWDNIASDIYANIVYKLCYYLFILLPVKGL